MNLSRRSAIALAATVLALCIAPLAMVQSASAAEFAARSNDMGGVRVVITPKAVTAKSDWEFAVTMDTHTKPLDDDLTKTAVLVDDGGADMCRCPGKATSPVGIIGRGFSASPHRANKSNLLSCKFKARAERTRGYSNGP
jgi:hypothetical protein